jgi:acetylornithine deacetylase/succinyl-diaminopimelate desuccinylase-like protein
VLALQSIDSRNLDPVSDTAVVSVGRLQAGTVYNVIAETAELELSVRSLSPTVREDVHRRIDARTNGSTAPKAMRVSSSILGPAIGGSVASPLRSAGITSCRRARKVPETASGIEIEAMTRASGTPVRRAPSWQGRRLPPTPALVDPGRRPRLSSRDAAHAPRATVDEETGRWPKRR